MKILVTGGAGFIASHIVDQYIRTGHQVIVIDNLSSGKKGNINANARHIKMDLADSALEQLIITERPDLINHHAAQVNVRASVDTPLIDLGVNLRDTIRLLDAAGKAKVKKFMFASSGGAVYGESQSPSSETDCKQPISPYGINKYCAEQYIYFFSKLYGFNSTILRYSNVYGPRQSSNSESGIIAILIDRISKGQIPIIYGDGEQIRDFVHVKDVVEANLYFSFLDDPGIGVFNVGTGIGTTINQLLNIMGNALSDNIKRTYLQPKSGEIRYNVLSIERIKSKGWKPKIDIKEGILELLKLNFLIKEL